MSLSSPPTFTAGSTGNLITSGSLSASASETAILYVGVSGQTGAAGSTTTGLCAWARVQIGFSTGSVSTTYGLQIQFLSTSDGGTTYDTNAYITGPTGQPGASSSFTTSIDVPPGQYKLKLTNLDGTNGLTSVFATVGTIG